MTQEIARDGELLVRLLRDDPAEYRLMAGWLNRPHVREWWDPDEPPITDTAVAAEYGPRTDPRSPTTSCVIELGGREAGYVQFYKWGSWPDEAGDMDVPFDDDSWGLDIFIGEPDLVGVGLGSRAVDLVCRYLFDERRASAIMLTTEIENIRAQRAYEKAGFRRVKEVLDTDTRAGERVRSWLMVRGRAAGRSR